MIHAPWTADKAWVKAFNDVITQGNYATPRKKLVSELLHQTHKIDLRFPLITHAGRKLHYRGAAAEAIWILEGSHDLADIEPFFPRMREFSDDGLTLTGAYGPKIVAQLGYVVDTIYADADTRQATLTLWTPSPVSSKDIPCTVAMDFKLRGGKLNMCVFMRSSDIWLGMPYDMFSFACVAYTVIARLRKHTDFNDIEPGFLWITAASSHLYEDRLGDIIEMGDVDPLPIPDDFWMSEELLHERLTAMRASHKGDPCRWWE